MSFPTNPALDDERWDIGLNDNLTQIKTAIGTPTTISGHTTTLGTHTSELASQGSRVTALEVRQGNIPALAQAGVLQTVVHVVVGGPYSVQDFAFVPAGPITKGTNARMYDADVYSSVGASVRTLGWLYFDNNGTNIARAVRRSFTPNGANFGTLSDGQVVIINSYPDNAGFADPGGVILMDLRP